VTSYIAITLSSCLQDIIAFFAQRCATPGVVTREDFEDYYGHLGAREYTTKV
jgi:hypothetical protein